ASLTVQPVPVATVAVAPPTQSVDAGSDAPAFTATTKDAGGNVLTGRVVTWSSSDNSIATVDNSGVATGVAPGTVTITATSEGQTGTASLEVDQVPVASVTVSPLLVSVATGATTQLTATVRDGGSNILTGRVVTWSSSDETIATVDSNGLVTGVAALLGAATITATSEGQSGTSIVTVLGLP
ncbi:MAG: Ig-like domain-containing protein, partial [Gemmatimonadaceae bacterium]